MTDFYLIGDVHGKFEKYKSIIGLLPAGSQSIQVGDLGIGFDDDIDEKFFNFFNENSHHRFMRGNHDDPEKCHLSQSYLKDVSCTEDLIGMSALLINGAYSIDKDLRLKIGYKWFENEELSHEIFNNLIDSVGYFKPEIIISHDCPSSVSKSFFGYDCKSRTAQGLQAIFEIHQPKLWVFGHHHQSYRRTINGTKFVCLDELEVASLTDLLKGE